VTEEINPRLSHAHIETRASGVRVAADVDRFLPGTTWTAWPRSAARWRA
jgi:hypothetical protein